jgi:hypothetical protein
MPVLDNKPELHRFGLVPAKIGASFAHKLGVPFPLTPPEYSTKSTTPGGGARTRAHAVSKPGFEYGTNPIDGSKIATKALPGTTIYLEVQDLSRVELELVDHVEWTCNHPDCGGKKYKTRDELVRAHGKDADLIAKAQQLGVERGGRAHVFFGVIELPAVEEKKDEKGRVVRPAQDVTVMLVSDEA